VNTIAFLLMAMILSPAAGIQTKTKASQQSVVYTCSMHPEVQSSKPGKCPKCGMKLVVEKKQKPAESPASAAAAQQAGSPSGRVLEAVKQADQYTCSMHPDIRTSIPGKCPKCGMTLVAVIPGIPEDFNLRMESNPAAPRANDKLRLRFSIFNPRTGEQVKKFQISHDKLFHLFIVSQDLGEFQHIHPTFEPDGSFDIETMLPAPGHYKIYSDFYPADGTPQVLQQSITTAGYARDLLSAQPKVKPDTSLIKTVDGMKIELTLDPQQLIAGQPVALKYHLSDAVSGEPVRNLVPYLGAWGHTLMLSEDQVDYVHSHPDEDVLAGSENARPQGGPDVTFNAFIPRPGNYRLWTQFQRGDTLTTVSFTIHAERLH